MRIGELARRSGVKPETIRFYEKTGVLDEPARTDGNYRMYDEAFLNRLIVVRELRDVGFEIAELPMLLRVLQKDPTSAVGLRQASDLRERLLSKMAVLKRLELALASDPMP